MKKTIVIFSALVTIFYGHLVQAEIYTYTGPNFTNTFGGYTTNMSVTASITTSTPIPPNETDYNIAGLITSWSMSDGVNTLQAPGSILSAVVDTDNSGHIVGGRVAAFTLPMRTQTGDIQDYIFTDSSGPLNQAVDDIECVEDDGNGTCTNNITHNYGEVYTYGAWTDDVVVAPPIDPPPPSTPIPTTSQWALIMLSMLICLMVFANRRRLF